MVVVVWSVVVVKVSKMIWYIAFLSTSNEDINHSSTIDKRDHMRKKSQLQHISYTSHHHKSYVRVLYNIYPFRKLGDNNAKGFTHLLSLAAFKPKGGNRMCHTPALSIHAHCTITGGVIVMGQCCEFRYRLTIRYDIW